MTDAGPSPYRYTNTCRACGCTWKVDDLSEPSPIEELCREPLADRSGRQRWIYRVNEVGCDCHNADWVNGYLDGRDRLAEERVMEIVGPVIDKVIKDYGEALQDLEKV